jgi:hypothetical protein
MERTRATGLVVLALGFAASASAVVPGFAQLLRGSTVYLGVMSLIGLAAATAGIHTVVTQSGLSLTIVMTAMIVMWFAATIHHARLARSAWEQSAGEGQHAEPRRRDRPAV